MRTSKVVDGVIYNYYYASGKLLRQTWGDNVLDFFYDASGTPYAMKYNGTTYYYVTNLQGNVERVVNSSGSVVAYYGYDPYGRITGTVGDLAEINPLRYRGYYYDTETGLYYLQSRYYDPTTGRFLNADAYASTGQGIVGHNMFAYCLNNPTCLADFTGFAPTTAIYPVCLGESRPKKPKYVEIAYEIGQRCIISEGTISINMDAEADIISELSNYTSIHYISFIIAVSCCNKYYDMYNVEFLLSDACVAYEIEEHIYSYYWATGERLLPNMLAVGYGAYQLIKKGAYEAGSVYMATKMIDIREADVVAGNMQAIIFWYQFGIRKEYIGSVRDPWAETRW